MQDDTVHNSGQSSTSQTGLPASGGGGRHPLKASLALLGQLHRLLDQEYQALEQLDNETLLHVIGKKQQILSQLKEQQSTLSAKPEASPQDARLRHKLHKVLRAIQHQNQINGRVVALSQQNTKDLFCLLTGQPKTGDLYSNKTSTPTTGSGRLLRLC